MITKDYEACGPGSGSAGLGSLIDVRVGGTGYYKMMQVNQRPQLQWRYLLSCYPPGLM